MEIKGESEKKKEKQVVKNGVAIETLAKDEAFWHSTLKNLSKELISEMKLSETNDTQTSSKHPDKVFCIHCPCSKCLIFRKLIVGIHVESEAYNDLWDKLKQIISSYYTMLPTDQEVVMCRKYQELQTESCGIRWLSDGSIDVDKNVHVSMGNYFSLSNEMTFIIVFNMLILRDRHQLFELLFLQLTSIVLAYREGIKEMTKCEHDGEEYYKPEEFLNYILDGYDKITEIADTLTPLVIEMRDHLQNFSLTWQLLNQCMYYRFLYVDIESHMAECILRLKDAVDAETYKSFVYRFIKFDEEMTQIGQVWEVALVALELYRKSTPEQVARVERIGIVRRVIQSLRELKELPENVVGDNDRSLSLEWVSTSEQDDVWLKVLGIIKNEKLYRDNQKRHCKCWACLISDGNTVPDICAVPDLVSSMNDDAKADQCYHLAWAVFKHLKDRQPYTKHLFRPETFCVFKDPPCQQTECHVATNLVIGSYPLSFTKFLLRTYQPLAVNDREKFLKVPSQSLIRKFCLKKGGAAAKEIMQEAEEINHSFLLLNMFWDDDDIADSMLRAGLAAALAENFKIDIKFPSRHVIFSYFYALFRVSAGDVQMDLEWLEKINLANLFKSFGVISNTINESVTLTSNSVEAIEMTLNELNITAEVSAGSNNTLDLVQFSMKEVADKLSSISLTDDSNENAKKVLENEIKKPLVEALKLAASNKKLEAELKSLQKEHNMLKDMVKGLEQIHGEKKELQVTVTTAPKTSMPDNAASKCGHGHAAHNHSQSGSTSPSMSEMDHGKDSGSGNDCVCYYCTLFGKNQDLMSSRSTETRDRLRKRLHHLQSQKDFSSKSKNLKNISLLLKNGAAAAAAASSQKVPTPKCNEATAHKCSNGNAPTGTSLKMKVELELQQRKKKVNSPKPNYANKPEEVKIQRATEINLKSLENLVEYIEGPSSKAVVEHKKAEEAAAKKQLKKAKQTELKVRRQIDSQLEVLNKLNSQIQEVVIDAKQVQNQLSQLKAGKGKTKELKKVKTAEDKLSELNSHRTKLENNAKAIFCDIKELNPSFDLHNECFEMKTVFAMLPPQPLMKPPMKIPVKPQTPPVNIPMAVPAQVRVQHQHFEQPRNPQPTQQQTPRLVQQQQPPAQQKKSLDDDPAKRMVTIRRINLPHAEPQVTVTAKGTTPDMDQLLYTFVNGQLVPASSLSPSAFQNGSIQLYMSSNGQTKMVVDNQLRKMSKNEVLIPSQQQQPHQQQQMTEKNKKKAATVENVSEKVKKKNEKKKEEPEPAITKKETEKQENSKKQKTTAKPDAAKAKVNIGNNNAKKKLKKAYIDPEFAANPFKLLDDDDEHSESGEDDKSDVVEEVIEPVKKIEEEPKTNGKKSKEDKKSAKKQLNTQPLQPVKSEKNKQKTNQLKNNDRKDSITSTASSNTSKDSKSKQTVLSNVRTDAPMSPMVQQALMSSNSIMDQLNRGVRVEGLRLPPGITLTKVAPSDSLGMKRESINRIAQPMQEFVEPRRPMNDPIGSMGDQNGIIMVESNPRAYNTQQAQQEVTVGKKKKKKQKQKAEATDSQPQMNNTHQQSAERMVTLKNPMFYNNPSEPMNTMMRNLQTPPFVSPMAEPPAASIIRNENGMYTIRNPTFQNAFSAPSPSNTSAPRQPVEPIARQFAPNKFAPYEGDVQPSDDSQPKCSSVIGSEMKNVLQRRKEQEFAANMDPYHQYGMRNQSSYSHFGGPGVNFNNNGTNCDDTYMSNSTANAFQPFPHSMAGNYDDLRLQPGQMLNSEVTIHNVTESKMFMNQAKKTPPPPIGTPRNGNMDGVVSMFGDLLISRPTELHNGNETSIFASKQNEKIADSENDRRFDFNHAPPKQQLIMGNESAKKSAITHRINDDFDKIQHNSTNSNSPISITSLDEIFECADDQKNGNGQKKSSFFPALQKFNDEKPSSGASSLFSSGI